ncbi:sulfate transporter CysZ [Fangia hongkongensis]|uniref:sulfate transporter CysZ n=1 Tax=Fangia hongkongensis TaxID=270495 RepID=UPI0003825E11|nr:sulfate transporter CysZ [Fangia hongkongensis]MBK2126198.1 sulfate transporter CysZ [Fangia hongkongensis]
MQTQNSATHYLFSGFNLIFSKGVKRFTLIPLIMNLILFIAIWYFALNELQLLTTWLDSHLPSWLDWINWLIYLIAIISLFLFSAYLFTAIALIIAAPFYSFLAEKIQCKLTKKAVGAPLTFKGFMLIAPKSIVRESKKLIAFLPWVIVILVCYFIPVINLFTGILWLILLSWFNVIQYADYPFDNNEIPFPMMKRQLIKKRTLSLSFGFITTIFLMIPILNIIVIPAAIAGATKMYVEEFHNQSSSSL